MKASVEMQPASDPRLSLRRIHAHVEHLEASSGTFSSLFTNPRQIKAAQSVKHSPLFLLNQGKAGQSEVTQTGDVVVRRTKFPK